MMTIVMIDVEAGKEDLFDRLVIKLNEMKNSEINKKIKILYLARCYTHADISIMIDVQDPEALPDFVIDLLNVDGVWDLQTIHLFNPNFFKMPKYIDKEKYHNFTVTLDVKSNKTEDVYKYLQEFAATEEAAITFLAYTFYSYDNDIIFSLLASDIHQAGKFVNEKIRSIDGVLDSLLWQIERSDIIMSHAEFVNYINFFRMEDLVSEELWDESFICAC